MGEGRKTMKTIALAIALAICPSALACASQGRTLNLNGEVIKESAFRSQTRELIGPDETVCRILGTLKGTELVNALFSYHAIVLDTSPTVVASSPDAERAGDIIREECDRVLKK
jgi:hypothetical protein